VALRVVFLKRKTPKKRPDITKKRRSAPITNRVMVPSVINHHHKTITRLWSYCVEKVVETQCLEKVKAVDVPIVRAHKLGNWICNETKDQRLHQFFLNSDITLFFNVLDSESASNPGDSEGALRASKSDTSLTDSFVMVTEADTKPRKINPQNILRDGFKWQRQLVFRSKLTMHTAYDRKDNAEPASITALAVSRYSSQVLVYQCD